MSSDSSLSRYITLSTVALAGLAVAKTLYDISASTPSTSTATDEQKRKRDGVYVPPSSQKATNPYETVTSLHEYLLMHYGTAKELISFEGVVDAPLHSLQFPKDCANVCIDLAKKPHLANKTKLRALDVGCAVGRSSFELTRQFHEVVGLDFSQAFIDACNELKSNLKMEYNIRVEGDITQQAVAQVDESLDRSRVRFVQGDACNLLSYDLGGKFDIILAANLLCRLPFPRLFLNSVSSLLNEGGYLVMPSPYTWLEAFTAKEEWIGARYDPVTKKPIRSFEVLKQILEESGLFVLVENRNMPFFIRETARKNQWSVSHLTIWKRTALQK